MHMNVKVTPKAVIAALGALALAVPAMAQQQGGPPPGAQQPPPGAGAQGGPPRQGGGPPPGGGFGGPPPAPNTGVPVYTTLKGARGTGHVTIVLDPPKGTACYMMNVSGVDGANAAHVHSADGKTVLTLEAPTDDSAGACQQVPANVSQAILGNPAGYYADVHTAASGTLSGYLAK